MEMKVLLLEDDAASSEAMETWLAELGCDVRAATSLEVARSLLTEHVFDLALIDVGLPDGLGTELLDDCNRVGTSTIMLSGRNEHTDVIAALRSGAHDYLTKPIDLDRLEGLVRAERKKAALLKKVRVLRSRLLKMGLFGKMVGRSSAMRTVYDSIQAVAPSSETVFLIGPTGVGKEVAAETIHEMSPRTDRPFVAVNCGAIAPTLLESEIFGHERGAFTGADRQHQGVFEQADGGTLFLDEVTEMSADLQTRLLRVLETHKITRVGSREEIPLDLRIIAATNRDPEEAVQSGALREDLFYRLQVFPIEIPPLRDRDGDIPLLATFFLDQLAEEHGERKSISDAAIGLLERHDWPGNVRELANVVRRAYILADERITERDIPLRKKDGAGDSAPAGRVEGHGFEVGESIAQVERRLIEATLQSVDGNKKRAAGILGISVKTLYARLQVYEAEARGVS